MITNSDSENFGKYCGTKSGTKILVTGDYARITFHSNYIYSERGFRIFFSFVGEWIQNGFLRWRALVETMSNTEEDKQWTTRQTCRQTGIEAHREKGRQTYRMLSELETNYYIEKLFSRHSFQMNKFALLLDCGARCAFYWEEYDVYKLSCWNLTTLLDVVMCFPRIVPALYDYCIRHKHSLLLEGQRRHTFIKRFHLARVSFNSIMKALIARTD